MGTTFAAKPARNAHKTAENESQHSNHTFKRHLFGIPRSAPVYDISDDYEERFPEDPVGEETGMNARVWRAYLAESMEYDARMVGEARDGLDAMLVFAGLFSAVVTSFLVQTSQNLNQPDFTEITAYLVSELINIQRAAADGNSVNNVPSSPLTPTSSFVPDLRAVWVNGLWVVSLSLGLVVALAAVLVKQWLHRYMAIPSGPPGERSHIRHYRYSGLVRWRVQGIIGSLPVVMHISLALFLLGLVIFFIPIHFALSCVVGGITLSVYILYLFSHLLPILDPQCPYQTPFSDFIVMLSAEIHTFAGKARAALNRLIAKITNSHYDSDGESDSDSTVSDEGPVRTENSLSPRDLEKHAVDCSRHTLSVEALHWLYNLSSDSSIRSLVLQAIGGLPPAASQKVQAVFDYRDIAQIHEHLLRSCTSDNKYPHLRHIIPRLHSTAERLFRLFIFFPGHGLPWPFSFSPSKDNRLEAAYLAQGSWGPSTIEEYRAYITSHTDLLHHPLVWVRLVQHAHQIGTFATYEDSSRISASFCRALLPAVWGPIPSTYTSSSEMIPLHVALRFHLPKDICLYLLGMLSRFDFRELSLNCRVVAAALEFALDHVSAGPSDLNGAHWDIIEYILNQSYDPAEMDSREHADFINFMADFVLRLIKKTGICDHPLRSEQLIARRNSVLKVYWAATMKQVYSQSSVSLEKPSFALLRRATQGTLRQLQLVADRTQLSKHMASNANRVFDILSMALAAGSAEAFQTVVDLDCLELFSKHHQPSQNVAMVNTYVAGLKLLPLDPARETYISHLYEPRNLHFAILSIFEWWPYVHSEHGRVIDLILLRPDDLAWDECRRWLKLVLEWAMNSITLESFIDRQLGEEWEWKIIRAYLIDSTSDSDDMQVDSDAEDLAAGSVYPEPIWSGISKLQGAIQSMDKFFCEREDDIESLIIPPSSVVSSTFSKSDMVTPVDHSPNQSKGEIEEDGLSLAVQVPGGRLLRWKCWIFNRLLALHNQDKSQEYV
ncbi:hypothetical protein GYMLUDRAFT_667740 [Collybiopsis luxurians FD-317 M1]|uniref:DUF6535 domain-containing protein n=1 Tax=Collybiopsis luxurians FD-317 M1 TaxID=944289 RepID=A0A0D0CAE4_9AGAR|nr:hypothetical protein GYMLUDRAFT_667740 [Collybiopsis luxurians FD-317 M1]